MKKTLLLTNEQYDGLKCYSMQQAGRLELLRVINDPPAYWLVMIRNFNPAPSGPDRRALTGITTAWGNGVFRFWDEDRAKAKFEQLASLPIHAREREKMLKIRDQKKERIKSCGDRSEIGLILPV
jgi:hypothetical protein